MRNSSSGEVELKLSHITGCWESEPDHWLLCIFLSRCTEESCECSVFRTKSQRNFTWFSGEKAQWSFLPVAARPWLLDPARQECSAVACDGVPGLALAVQSHGRFYDAGLSGKVSHPSGFSLWGSLFSWKFILCILHLKQSTALSWGRGVVAEAGGGHLPLWKAKNSWFFAYFVCIPSPLP